MPYEPLLRQCTHSSTAQHSLRWEGINPESRYPLNLNQTRLRYPFTEYLCTAGTILCIFFLLGWACGSSNDIFFFHGSPSSRLWILRPLVDQWPISPIAVSKCGWGMFLTSLTLLGNYIFPSFLPGLPRLLQSSQTSNLFPPPQNCTHDIIFFNFLPLNQNIKKPNVAYISPIPYIKMCASFSNPKELPSTLQFTHGTIHHPVYGLSTLNVRRSTFFTTETGAKTNTHASQCLYAEYKSSRVLCIIFGPSFFILSLAQSEPVAFQCPRSPLQCKDYPKIIVLALGSALSSARLPTPNAHVIIFGQWGIIHLERPSRYPSNETGLDHRMEMEITQIVLVVTWSFDPSPSLYVPWVTRRLPTSQVINGRSFLY